jgi:alpha-amylase
LFKAIIISLMTAFGLLTGLAGISEARDAVNGVMLQYFHWYLTSDGDHWRRLSLDADQLANAGFTAL